VIKILVGDALDRLRALSDKSVNCCVTSPPYFGLRDYGINGQIGLEPTPDEFVTALVAVFREVRRVLRDDGTLWLNIGDSYARAPAKGGSGPGKNAAYGDAFGKARRKFRAGSGRADGKVDGRGIRNRNGVGSVPGLRDKELIGVPWMLAFALRADGWLLRQDIIWSKLNGQPEPVVDRCTKSHEYLFLLVKNSRYYFDFVAILEPEVCGRKRGPALHGDAVSTNGNGGLAQRKSTGFRRKRSVWETVSEPYAEAHFATYPPALIEPCILAGCPKGGTVLDPFGGAGTTGLVADRFGREAILIELNPDYAALAERRLKKDGGMLTKIVVE
jgi:DNA modification methylase